MFSAVKGGFRAIFQNGRGALRNGGWILCWICFWYPATAVGYLIAGPLGQGGIGSRAVGSLALVAAALICLRLQRRPLREIGILPDRRWLKEAGAGLVLGGGIMLGTALLLRIFGGFHWEAVPFPGFQNAAWGLGLFVSVALFEELMFRGYPFQRLVDGLGPWPAQLLAAGYFAWNHWRNPGLGDPVIKALATANIALASILLGLAYLRTRSLALPIGLHLGWNWTQGCLLGFPVSGTTDAPAFLHRALHARPGWITGGEFGLEGSVLCTAIAGGWVLWWGWQSARRNPFTGGPSTGGAPPPAPR